jgi:hypothetical protein
VRSWGSSGWSFYKRPGKGGGEVASTGKLVAAAMMAHSGGDGMARAGARRQGRKAPTLLASVLMARRRGGWRPVAIASIDWSRARGRG